MAATFSMQGIAAPSLGGCQIFPQNNIFNTRIDALPVHPNSSEFIKRIGANHDGSGAYTGTSTKLVHLDMGTQSSMIPTDTYYGIPYNLVNTAVDPSLWKRVRFVYNGIDADLGYTDESDCAIQQSPGNFVPVYPCTPSQGTFTYMPILPIGSATGGTGELKIEGGVASGNPTDPNAAYNQYGDHHILSIDAATCILWEAYHAYPLNGSASASEWEVLSIAKFDLSSNALRENGATSADAAGFPIFPLLLRAAEANAGPDGIQHALRFTLQNAKVRGAYEWPARHLTGSRPADDTAADDGLRPVMGQLFRLRGDFDITTLPSWPVGQVPHAQTVAVINALKRYGMYIADNGSNMYIQGEPNAAWASQTFSQLQRIPHTAFEAVDLTPFKLRPGFDINSGAVPATAALSSPPFDLTDDGKGDIVWRNAGTGENYLYPMDGRSILASEGPIRSVAAPWTVAGVGDFDGDGKADLLWRNTSTGENYLYFMDGKTILAGEGYIRSVPTNWVVAGVGDFDGDGKADILWRNTTTGENYLYFMDGKLIKAAEGYTRSVPTVWSASAVGDFDGDGKADILWRNSSTGENYLYFMDGKLIKATEGYLRSVPSSWVVAGSGDFDGDGKADLLWRNTSTGENYLYFLDGKVIKATEGFIRSVATSWITASVTDFDGDGKADILWRNTTTGENYIYPMDGRTIKATEGFIRSVPPGWSVVTKQ